MSDDDSLIGAGCAEGATAEPTDAEMERLLLDNLSSGSDLDQSEEEKGPPKKKRKKRSATGSVHVHTYYVYTIGIDY